MSQNPPQNVPPNPSTPPPPGYSPAPGYPTAPQAGPPGYPAAPGGGPAGQPGPVARPKPIDLAVKLMYAGAALSLVGILLSFTQQDAVREIAAEQPGMTPESLDTVVAIGLVFGAFFGLIGVGLWILNAVFNGKGKKWARILSTVLGALSIVSFLFSLVQPTTGVSMLLGVVQVALAAVILWLLWRPESSRFYEAMSAPRF